MPHKSNALDFSKMSVKLLKQELTQRGLAAHGLKPVLVERFKKEMEWKNSNKAFHSCIKQIEDTAVGIASAEEDIAALEGQLAQIQMELDAARQRIPVLKHEQTTAQRELKELEPRLFFAPKLPSCVLLSIVGQLGKRTGQRTACVKREWRDSVVAAKGLGMCKGKPLLSVAAGGHMTAVCTAEGLFFTFGHGHRGNLGHGGKAHERVPRLVEALTCKKVIGVTGGDDHTAVWTDDGELFTFGHGAAGRLGHGGTQTGRVPRLVEALAGKKVVGATARFQQTMAWTETGEFFTFGNGSVGSLGHGGGQHESVPRLVAALVGKKVVGASAGSHHTAVWTDDGELFTFGNGHLGQLGHGGTLREYVPRLVQALAGKKVTGAVTGSHHTAVWTEEGELFTFGAGNHGMLGHGGKHDERVPRLVGALVGKKVIGTASGGRHTAVWTEAGELFTFGYGAHGELGHGGQETERVPRLVGALASKKMVGAAAGQMHTAVWTDDGELFTFGFGYNGRLGHGEGQNELVPRLVEALPGA